MSGKATNSSFWASKYGTTPDLLCGRPADYLVEGNHFSMLVFAIIALGGILKMVLKNSEAIVFTIISLCGFVLGHFALHFVEVHQIVYALLRTPSFSLFCYFSPLIIFMAALDMDFYTLKNVFWQVLLIGLISTSTALVTLGYVVPKFNKDSWDLQSCLFFGITLGITDPLHSVNSLKNTGIPKIYADIIRGESLIICSLAAIFFGLFRSNTTYTSMYRELYIFIGVFLDVFGSIICGYWCAKIIQHMLTDPFSNTMTDIIFCLSMVYMTFYIVEFLGMSGILALVTVGLNLDSLSFRPRSELIITKFLVVLSSAYQHLTYAFFGIVIGCGEIEYINFHTIVFILILFVTVNFARLLTVLLASPILKRLSKEYDWRWGVVISWSGIRGVFSLLLAPEAYNLVEQKVTAPHMFILYIQVVSLLTMGINTYMMIHSARTLGLFAISLPRQIIMQNIIQHINEIIQSTITLSKTEKLLTNVNWNFVEEKSKIEYINPVSDDEEEEEESPTDAVLIEEARLPVAMMQISSFEKQCHDEVLEIEAARILIGAAKRYCPIQGRFLSIYDVSTYVRTRNWLMKFKNVLTFLEYRKEKLPFILPGLRPENLVLIQCTVIMGYLRIIRFLPILKVIIPVLKNIADVQLQKHLSLMYCVTKGYVKSLEDAKLLIKQISGRESVYQKLYEILETNQQDAIKELGLMEHENRDVVIAAKTKLVIRNVISDSLKDLAFLRSRGIIDKYEGIEIKTALFKKLKVLENFPMAIPPPAPHEYLHNFIWLENEDLIIDFFRDKVTLACFDYGDIICREGEMPTGIYLIISGMAILRGSPPSFGVESSQRPDRESKTMFTEYCTSGDIIGELSCLLKHEIEYTAICETVLEACFISMEDLYEGFDAFWPFLEHKIWLKLALSIAHKYFESSISNEDLEFQKCVTLKHAYVETLSSDNEMVINNMTMKLVILVYGSVIDTMTEQIYLAPCIIPKTCEQVQGIADLTKLLVIRVSEPSKKSNTPVMDHRVYFIFPPSVL